MKRTSCVLLAAASALLLAGCSENGQKLTAYDAQYLDYFDTITSITRCQGSCNRLRVRSCIREVQRYQGRRYGGSIHDGRGTALVFCGDDLKIHVTAHKRDSHGFPELWKGSTEFSVLPLRVFRERNEIECEKTALKIQELIWKCRESSARSSAPRSRTRG